MIKQWPGGSQMTMVAVGVLTIIASYLISYWRDLEHRRIRWQLYALRDQLRAAAIEDRGFRESEQFSRLDESLSDLCKHLSEFSLWSIPAAIYEAKHSTEIPSLEGVLRSDFKITRDIVVKASSLLIQSILLKHLFVFLLLVITVVGIIPLFIAYRRLVDALKKIIMMPELYRYSGRREAQSPA